MSDAIRPKELTLLSAARRTLAKADTVDEITDIRDKAQAAKAYASKARLGLEVVIEAASIKLQAERKLGAVLAVLPLAKGHRSHRATGIRLRDLGLSKSESSRAQLIASLPKEVFEGYLELCRKNVKEPTSAAVLRMAKGLKSTPNPTPTKQRSETSAVIVEKLQSAGQKFTTIYADIPWNSGRHGRQQLMERLCGWPVSRICTDNAHLHLWSSPDALADAIRVVDAWGFEYASNFVWVRQSRGTGKYWQSAHEVLLFGVRGELPFQDKQRSWIRQEATPPMKPTMVRSIIETVSPPPYLQLYGNCDDASAEWTVLQ